MAQTIDKLDNLVGRQEQSSKHNCLLEHEIAETNNEDMEDFVFKTINEKLDINITDN